MPVIEIKFEVSEEPATVTVGHPATPQTVTPVTNEVASVSVDPLAAPLAAPPAVPLAQSDAPVAVKTKRATSEKQRKNYLAANARRVQILADAKILRVAEAYEKKREKDAFEEYATATRLALKYGFTVPNQLYQHHQPNQPPTQSVAIPVAPVRAAEIEMALPPPPLRYYERPPTSIRYV
ncbi:hypothetical protein T492DRAFT_839624 [Pavlovales sp. CCMP2436]|nr:hypothetical protein T492DRAFT_839624 [Pavlovales sp. CCMP2436]